MGKYEPLTDFLNQQKSNKVSLKFSDIEEIISAKLPKSATTYDAWWGNTPIQGRQSDGWLDANFIRTDLCRERKTVSFERAR